MEQIRNPEQYIGQAGVDLLQKSWDNRGYKTLDLNRNEKNAHSLLASRGLVVKRNGRFFMTHTGLASLGHSK